MVTTIIEEIAHVLGTLFAVLLIRYMLELSSPQKDMYVLRNFWYGLVDQWKQGQFEVVHHALRARKLLDY